MKEQVLFVDDDDSVLANIQHQLRDMAEEWSMVFSEGGEDAMNHLRKNDFSVIISDVDNKNEDGIHLMEHVKEEFPDVARVILSSNLETAQLHHAADHKHFYLRKGGKLNEFVTAIREAILMHNWLREHPRPLSPRELTEVLVDYFKREMQHQRITLNDVPERIRPYLSQPVPCTTVMGGELASLEKSNGGIRLTV